MCQSVKSQRSGINNTCKPGWRRSQVRRDGWWDSGSEPGVTRGVLGISCFPFQHFIKDLLKAIWNNICEAHQATGIITNINAECSRGIFKHPAPHVRHCYLPTTATRHTYLEQQWDEYKKQNVLSDLANTSNPNSAINITALCTFNRSLLICLNSI